jgi:hypothetical protein
MTEDEEWFLTQGFLVELEQQGTNPYWAHLVHRSNPDNPQGRAPKYGNGKTRESAIRSARQRYEVEQLGIKPTK